MSGTCDTNAVTQKPGARAWTSKQLAELRRLAPMGVDACADLLDRSPESIRQAAKRHRISLRQPGSRRGLILGQPRGTSWAILRTAAEQTGLLADLRDRVLAGEIDPAGLERRALDLLAHGAELCPRCVARPVLAGHRSGLCDVCWRRSLNEALAHEQLLETERREGDRLKQANSRRRRRPDPERTTAP